MSDLLEGSEHETIRACLVAAAEGPFFPDWEFETLVGSSRDEVRELAAGWPSKGSREAIVVAAGVLNNLIGYPHGEERKLAAMVGVSAKELGEVLEKLNQLERAMGSAEESEGE
jgi:hypothetical protein